MQLAARKRYNTLIMQRLLHSEEISIENSNSGRGSSDGGGS